MSSRRFSAGVLSVALVLASAAPAAAGDYPSFDGVTTLHLNGSAAVVTAGPANRAVLRLTGGPRQRGSAWDQEKVDVTRSFGTSFYVMLDGRSGAGGIAFVLQSAGSWTLERRGVAITFDDATDEVALLPGAPTRAAVPLTGSPFLGRVGYDAATQRLRAWVSAPDADEQLVVDRIVDLRARLGTDLVWAGFTGATGDSTATQDVISWEPA